MTSQPEQPDPSPESSQKNPDLPDTPSTPSPTPAPENEPKRIRLNTDADSAEQEKTDHTPDTSDTPLKTYDLEDSPTEVSSEDVAEAVETQVESFDLSDPEPIPEPEELTPAPKSAEMSQDDGISSDQEPALTEVSDEINAEDDSFSDTSAAPTAVAAAAMAGAATTASQTSEESDKLAATETANSTSVSTETVKKPAIPQGRLLSLDALRGFDMFWIVGAHGLFLALTRLLQGYDAGTVPAWLTPWLDLITVQLEHVSWEGFHFYDLIFPMFVFITGASTVFSISKRLQTDSKSKIFAKILWRTIFLYALGLFYYAGMDEIQNYGDLRYMGVLQRIAIAYGFGATLFLFLNPRWLIASFAIILIGYYALVAFMPFEGSSELKYSQRFDEGPENNFVNNFDSKYLAGYKWDGTHDPEGVLSNIPAVGSCLLGLFAGMILINPDRKKSWKFSMLLVLGIVSLALGYGWGLFFPVIKKLWTSSFVLMAGGWSFLLLAFFFLVVDIWKFKYWAMPFVWIGSNAITIYMMWQIIDFDGLAGRIIQFALANQLGAYAPLAKYFLSIGFAIAILRFLYIRKIHIRI